MFSLQAETCVNATKAAFWELFILESRDLHQEEIDNIA